MREKPKLARNADIRLRRSAVPGNVPTPEQLNLGELAVNTADGKLFLKRVFDGIEQVVEIGADAAAGLISTFNNYIYTSDGTLQTIGGADDFNNHLSYDLASPRRLQVFLNGVLLHQGIDYTADDGLNVELTYPVSEGQVIQISAYNSDGASINADLIMDDGYSFTVGTDEETKFYHNGSNTIIKHMAYGDNTFKMMWRDSDRIEMGEFGVNITGQLTINDQQLVTDSDVNVLINNTVTKQYVEDLDLDASSILYATSPSGVAASNVQEAIDILQDTKLDVTALTANVTFYPTTTPVGSDFKLVTSIDDPDFNDTAVDINTGIIDSSDMLIATLISDAGVLEGSTGSINVHTIGNVRSNSSDGSGEAIFYFEVYKVDSSNIETLIGISNNTLPVSTTTYSQFFADAVIDTTEFTLTDKVAIKYYGTATTSNHTSFDFQFGGSQPVRTNFPVPLSVIPEAAKHAHDINVDVSNFRGVLSGADTHVQHALETIDALNRNDFIPDSDNVYSLGSLDKAWKDVFVGPGSLYINGCKILGEDSSMNITMTTDPNQDLILAPGEGGNLIFEVDSGQAIQFNSPVNLTTADIAEDSSNQYFTQQKARTSVSRGFGVLYDEGTGVISVDISKVATKLYSDGKDSDTLVSANEYSDLQDEIILVAANNYTDSSLSDLSSYLDAQDSATLVSANAYADSTLEAAKLYADSQDALTLLSANAYADGVGSDLSTTLTSYTDTAVTNSVQSANSYTDQEIQTATTSLQNYADSNISIAISNLVDNAPAVLDTLNEISAALGDDSDFIGTVQGWINQKLDKTATTDDITEGSTNKYFTEERVRNSVSGGNGISFDPETGEFSVDSSASFDTITATTFVGDLQGNAATATTASNADYASDADTLDGQHGSYYRINIYDAAGNLIN